MRANPFTRVVPETLSYQRSLEEYLTDFSCRCLPEVAEGVRDVSRERRRIEDYIASLPVERIRLFEELATDHPPMSPDTRLAVLLPARMEERRIGRFLEAFDREILGSDRRAQGSVELLVLVNWRHGESPDATAELVRRHAASGPPYHLLCIERRLDKAEERHPLPAVRGLMADYALFRAVHRQRWNHPLYLLSEDADVEDIEPGRSAKMIDYLDRHPGVDAIRGIQDRTQTALASNNLLLFERRSWSFAETLMSQPRLWPARRQDASFHWNRVVTGGWNTCFTAEVYAMIDGYSPELRIFEDRDIGQRISVLRGRWSGERFIPDVSTVTRVPYRATSSAARAILALAEARHIYDRSNDFDFFFDICHEQAVRRLTVSELLDRIAEYAVIGSRNLTRFETVARSLLAEVLEFMGRTSEAVSLFRRAMWLTGWREGTYRLRSGGKIDLLDCSSFRRLAAQFALRELRTHRLQR